MITPCGLIYVKAFRHLAEVLIELMDFRFDHGRFRLVAGADVHVQAGHVAEQPVYGMAKLVQIDIGHLVFPLRWQSTKRA